VSETQEASIGWGGEFELSTDDTVGNLAELVQVVSFGLPEIEVDQVETTHLKSADRFKEFGDGLADGGEIEIVFNFRPGSDTDEALDDWEDARGKRKVRFGVPLGGTVVKTYTCSATFAGYNRGTVSAGDKLEATLRIKLSGTVTKAAV
jgi:hypothetical protein